MREDFMTESDMLIGATVLGLAMLYLLWHLVRWIL